MLGVYLPGEGLLAARAARVDRAGLVVPFGGLMAALDAGDCTVLPAKFLGLASDFSACAGFSAVRRRRFLLGEGDSARPLLGVPGLLSMSVRAVWRVGFVGDLFAGDWLILARGHLLEF